MTNPLNLGNSIAEDVMNFFNEEQYRIWKDTEYPVNKKVLDNFEVQTNKPNIVIIGDYDVDGIMSIRLMVDLLQILHPESNVSYIIPRRFTDGYGISNNIKEAIAEAFEPNDTCIVTVDNGISQFAPLNFLYEKGYSIVLTDHHEPQANKDGTLHLPMADCIINPHILDDKHKNDFAFEHYCGTGVVYRLAKSLINDEELLKTRFLPYAAIATIADVVPLIEDNWVMVRSFLDESELLLPKELDFLTKPAKYLDEEDIKFTIVPILNAAGRLLDDGADKVVKYLLNPTPEVRKELLALNEQRKKMVEEQTSLVVDYIETQGLSKKEPICVNISGLHHGIIGIIAGKVTEKYNLACLICSDGKGSGRSPDRFNLFEFCSSHLDLFDTFGGHPGACGFSISEENLKKLSIHAKLMNIEREKRFDIRLKKDQISEFYQKSKPCRPFGQGNPAPRCVIEITPTDDIEFCGKDEKGNPKPMHLSIKNSDGSKIMHFYHNKSANDLTDPKHFDGIGKINLNFFQNTVSPQFTIDEVYDPEEPPLTIRR